MPSKSLKGHPLELLSLDDAAASMNTSVPHVELMIAAKQLRAFRFGEDGQIVRVLRLDLKTLRPKNSCRLKTERNRPLAAWQSDTNPTGAEEAVADSADGSVDERGQSHPRQCRRAGRRRRIDQDFWNWARKLIHHHFPTEK